MSIREDYFLTFYATPHGQRALADLRSRVRATVVNAPEIAVGKCMLEDLLRYITETAGAVDDLQIIGAEAAIAAQYKEPEKPKPDYI